MSGPEDQEQFDEHHSCQAVLVQVEAERDTLRTLLAQAIAYRENEEAEDSTGDQKLDVLSTGCIDCTSGCVPDAYNTGRCWFHAAKEALRASVRTAWTIVKELMALRAENEKLKEDHEIFLFHVNEGCYVERDALRAGLAAAEAFKAFVHRYLDEHGVPSGDPENQHQKEGCRIGARLDIVFAERARAQAAEVCLTGDVIAMKQVVDAAIAYRDTENAAVGYRELAEACDRYRASAPPLPPLPDVPKLVEAVRRAIAYCDDGHGAPFIAVMLGEALGECSSEEERRAKW